MTGQTNVSIHGREFGLDLPSNRLFTRGRPYGMTMTPTPGATNATCVVCQITDYYGSPVAGVFNFDIWLSDAATGAGLTSTTASGTVANGGNASGTVVTAAGADFAVYTAKKALYVQTDATGKYTLSITDTAKTAFKVCAINPADGQAIIGATLAGANYG